MRRFVRVLIFILCLIMVTTVVSAQSEATEVSSVITVSSDGRCQVMTTVWIHLIRRPII